MAAKQLQDHAAARRERNTDGNQLGADVVASGMAAAGLGLALLHQDLQSAEASTAERLRNDGTHDVAPSQAESQQQHAVAPQAMAESNADRSGNDQPFAAPSTASDETLHTGTFSNGEHSAATVAPELPSSLNEPVAVSQSATGSTASSSSAGSTQVQDALSDTSSSLSAMTASFQQQINDTANSLAHSVDGIVSGVTDSLSSLTTQLSSHAGGTLAGISETLLGAAPAPVQIDPIFQGVFGLASGPSASQFAHDVVDTGGLASFGDVTHGFDLGFLGQSYTELADHTLTGTPGMGHGLI